MGTVEYLAPEQALGEEADALSDLYGVGVVLFEMLTGDVPHRARSSLGTLLAHVQRPAPDLHRLRPEVPDWLAAVAARLLAKVPADRYPRAADALRDLEQERSSRRLRGGRLAAACTVLMAVTAAAGVLYEPLLERARIGFVASGHDRAEAAVDLAGDRLEELVLHGIDHRMEAARGADPGALLARIDRQLARSLDTTAMLLSLQAVELEELGRHQEALEAVRRADEVARSERSGQVDARTSFLRMEACDRRIVEAGRARAAKTLSTDSRPTLLAAAGRR